MAVTYFCVSSLIYSLDSLSFGFLANLYVFGLKK